MSKDISKLHPHAEFQGNRPIRVVSSDVHRQTGTHADIRKVIFIN